VTLQIRLLGELDLRRGDAALPPLDSARAESLLAYLLLHRDAPQSRQSLAYLFWPDSSEPQAQTNLRHVLHNLRRTLPDLDQFVEVTPRALRWRTDSLFWLDVAAFEQAISRAEKETGDMGLAALQKATELYVGDLLDGCYDEWLLGERERLRKRYLTALEQLAHRLAARGNAAQAIECAERLLRHDPLQEETYRLLMRLHDARGDRARALRVYHVCAATLERELGVEPAAPTRAAYEALLPAPRVPAARERPAGRVGGPPLVGRSDEWRRLTDFWRATETSGAQLILVAGEAGIGKTRLIEELRAWCGQRGAASAVARSYAAEGALAYGPVVGWLRSEPLKTYRRHLDRALLAELARLLPELLVDNANLVRPEPLPEREQRQRLFDAAARAILAIERPLLLVAEDLHWWDRESLQFLHYLLRCEPDARLLVAATARHEDVESRHALNELCAGLRRLGRITEIELGRLSRDETVVLAERMSGQPLALPDADQFFRETEGNPLFVVEALRAGWTGRGDGRGWTSPKVQSVIESRLGQLSGPTRALVGVAATIGREFTSDVLARAGEADESTLVRSLDELWRRRIIREQGVDAYDFSHDKIREVAYLALSPAQRRHHHLHVARALAHLSARDPGAASGQIARHYERAGATAEAVTWYERAAGTAQQLYASVDAVRWLDHALDLLCTLPPTPERDACELAILSALPAPLNALHGYASTRFADIHRRAGELARALGVELAPPLLRSLAVASLANGDFETARQTGAQLHGRGAVDGNDMLLIEADYVLGIAAYWSGDLAAARRHFEAAVERYRPEQRHTHLREYGQDPKVVCLGRLALTFWYLGDSEAATRARAAACAWADDIGHPFTRSVAVFFAALLALDMRDQERLREYAAEMRRLRSTPYWWMSENIEALDGYLDALAGRTDIGVARVRRALAESLGVTRAPAYHANIAHVLLETCALAGDARAGLDAAERSWGLDGVHLWDAEIHRLQAEFRATLGMATEQQVEAELDRAVQIARGQGARIFELRAAATLLRHRLARADTRGVRDARDRLAEIIAALPEERDTPDLREAANLLTN
jgi:DNA-binding SARP family transcriptional activator